MQTWAEVTLDDMLAKSARHNAKGMLSRRGAEASVVESVLADTKEELGESRRLRLRLDSVDNTTGEKEHNTTHRKDPHQNKHTRNHIHTHTHRKNGKGRLLSGRKNG